MEQKFYRWIAVSYYDIFHDESDKLFKTKEEAYLDMRNATLEKMKLNTELSDIEECNDLNEEYIGYQMKFFKDKIIHNSDSGVYTYRIIEVNLIDYIYQKIEQCEKLVFNRFTYASLEKTLNNIFQLDGHIIHAEEIEQSDVDYRMTYVIDAEHCFDIYFLKMRMADENNDNNIYITEIENEIY